MDAIVAATRDNALTVGLPDDLGVLEAGRLADVLILTRDPLADIRVLQGGKHLAAIIKDGKRVGLSDTGGLATTPQVSPGSERPGESGALLEMGAGE
jgi:cytosine/adenosine deaminase-related metal-dependent hydrolase